MSGTRKVYLLRPAGAPKTEGRGDRARVQKNILESWMPANQQLISKIRTKIRQSEYQRSSNLLEDIKQDIGLYSFVLRRLSAQLASRTNKEEVTKDIFSYVQGLSISEISSAIPLSSSRISRFKLDEASEPNVNLLRSLIISTTSSQMLGGGLDLDRETCFNMALFRQLGIVLFAWNYPRIYGKLLDSGETDLSKINRKFEELLGYSPAQLSSDMLLGATARPEVELAIDSLRQTEGAESVIREQDISAEALSKLKSVLSVAKIGEALAQGCNHNPGGEASEKFDWAEEQIKKILGSDGLKEIASATRARWQQTASALPVLYQGIISSDGQTDQPLTKLSKAKYMANSHIQLCSRMTQENFIKTYKEIQGTQPSRQALLLLISEVIPRAGFSSGCIYLFEGERLSPAVFIGNVNKAEYLSILSPSMGGAGDPIPKALRYGRPVRGFKLKNRREVFYIAGAIGATVPRGVLYLESEQSSFEMENDPADCFSAIVKCLTDALSLDKVSQATPSESESVQEDPLVRL